MRQDHVSDARERLVDTATALFSRKGIPNVGINEVIASAGIARRTLYHHFASKDALVLAVLQRSGENFRAAVDQAIADRATPGDRLLAIFEVGRKLFESDRFRGCATINAALETACAESPVHALAREQKKALHATLTALAADAGVVRSETLGWQLLLLWDGALAECYIQQSAEPLRAAAEAAEQLIDGHRPRR